MKMALTHRKIKTLSHIAHSYTRFQSATVINRVLQRKRQRKANKNRWRKKDDVCVCARHIRRAKSLKEAATITAFLLYS